MAGASTSRIESLEAEVRRLRGMLACAPDFIARVTLDGTFLYLNHTVPGFALDEVVGTSVFAYIPEPFHARAREAMRLAAEKRTVQQYATVGPITSERQGHYLTRVSPVIEDGEVTSLVMASTDVTAVEEHRALLQLALEAMDLGTFRFHPATGDGSMDEVARAVFGLQPGATIPGMARFMEEYLHPDDRERVAAAFEHMLVTERFGPLEYRIRGPGGRTRWVSAAGTTVRAPDGKLQEIVGTIKDVTERRTLEARLRDAEKLESVGRLAGGVAHDFNNMLTAILGNVAFAATVRSLEEVRPLLEEIRVAAERSAALTAQLLAFARRQLVEPKLIAPDASIRRLEPLLRRLLDERIQLALSLSASGHVRLGESQLERIVMNLVTNARDAIAGPGRIGVETRSVSLDDAASNELGLPSGEYVELTVSDTGRGISAAIRPHLFEPFFTTRDGGTGLGLATCYGIAQQNGGTIGVDSEFGHGASFRVYLPRVDAGVTTTDIPASSKRSVSKIKVLIVEDEDAVRRVLERALRGLEFTVSVAGGVEEARRAARELGPFDALVTDIVMPDGDGHDLARELRENRPELRVLLISGYSQELPLKEGPQDRVAFLQKPFEPSEIATAVRELCRDLKTV
jgi:PAS domain S-box-containing protein